MVIAPSGSHAAATVIDAMAAWLEAPGEPEPWVVETSGSTGVPKQVRLSRRAVIASAEASARRVGGAGPWVLALPPSYVAGLNVIARSLLAGHRPVVLGESGPDGAADLDAAVERLGDGAFLSMVPTQLKRALETHRQALGSMHTLLLGGGPIDPSLRAAAVDLGVRVVATYGSAETCGGCVYDGVPLDGVGLAIGAQGRVRLSGPTLADGYTDPELSAASFVDGWFLTSDAGRIDSDGRLQVLGRLDDMVITGGVNVPAAAVAARLRTHPEVQAAEVLGVPDDEWGNRLVAFVQRRAEKCQDQVPQMAESGAEPDTFLGVLRDWVSQERPRSWAPRELILVEEIPLLPNGKTDRMALKALVR